MRAGGRTQRTLARCPPPPHRKHASKEQSLLWWSVRAHKKQGCRACGRQGGREGGRRGGERGRTHTALRQQSQGASCLHHMPRAHRTNKPAHPTHSSTKVTHMRTSTQVGTGVQSHSRIGTHAHTDPHTEARMQECTNTASVLNHVQTFSKGQEAAK